MSDITRIRIEGAYGIEYYMLRVGCNVRSNWCMVWLDGRLMTEYNWLSCTMVCGSSILLKYNVNVLVKGFTSFCSDLPLVLVWNNISSHHCISDSWYIITIVNVSRKSCYRHDFLSWWKYDEKLSWCACILVCLGVDSMNTHKHWQVCTISVHMMYTCR